MSSSSPQPESWISAFCALVGHEYFAEVSEDFIEDDFNLTGLQSQVPMYKEALEMILDVEPEDVTDEDEEEEEEEEDDEDDEDMQDGDPSYRMNAGASERRHLRMASDLSVIESSAEMLYGLIHQRFITSRAGIQQMAEKYEMGHFGYCPRVFCHSAKVLPVGCSDIPGQETVKLFCPSCLDVYTPPNSRFQTVDGAFFGTTFGCLFFMTFPEMSVGGTKPLPTADPSPSTSATAVASSSLNPPNGTAANGVSQSASNASRSLSSSLTSLPRFPPTSQQSQQASSSPPSSQPAQPAQPASINGVSLKNLAPGLGPGSVYEPRIYGFRVSEFAKTGPRMKWLRARPIDAGELDECRLWSEGLEAARQKYVIQQQQQQPKERHPEEENQTHSAGGRVNVSGAPVVGDDSEMVDQAGFDDDREEGVEEQITGAHDFNTAREDHQLQDGYDHEDPGIQREEDLPAPEGVGGAEVREVAARKIAATTSASSTSAPRRRTVGDGYPNGDGGGGGTVVRVGEGG